MALCLQRLAFSWEDYSRDWCRRGGFHANSSGLLAGEDPDFVADLKRLVTQEKPRAPLPVALREVPTP